MSYNKELLDVAGISDSRVIETKFAVAGMHKALCMMDNNNRAIFLAYVESCGGFLGLIQRYAETEELNNLK
jgi:hypothetical protein